MKVTDRMTPLFTSDHLENLRVKLRENGWKQYFQPKEAWYKDFPANKCSNNTERAGIQVGLEIYSWKETQHIGYTLKIRAAKNDKIWTDIGIYGFQHPSIEFLEEQSLQLVKAWDAITTKVENIEKISEILSSGEAP